MTQLGTIFQPDEEEDHHNNANSFINSQTIEVHINNAVDIIKPPFYGFDTDANTLFVRGLSKEVSKYDIKSIVEKL